jgi:hypothetical protein
MSLTNMNENNRLREVVNLLSDNSDDASPVSKSITKPKTRVSDGRTKESAIDLEQWTNMALLEKQSDKSPRSRKDNLGLPSTRSSKQSIESPGRRQTIHHNRIFIKNSPSATPSFSQVPLHSASPYSSKPSTAPQTGRSPSNRNGSKMAAISKPRLMTQQVISDDTDSEGDRLTNVIKETTRMRQQTSALNRDNARSFSSSSSDIAPSVTSSHLNRRKFARSPTVAKNQNPVDVLLDFLSDEESEDQSDHDAAQAQAVDTESLLKGYNVEQFHEDTVRLALRAARLYTQNEPSHPLQNSATTSSSPFDKIIVEKKGATTKSRLLSRTKASKEWQHLPAPLTRVEDTTSGIPRAKSIGRLGLTLLGPNNSIGKYHHYSQDDEQVSYEDREKKYGEIRERYHDYSDVFDTFSRQRDCAEIVGLWRPFAEDAMAIKEVSATDIAYYYHQSKEEAIATTKSLAKEEADQYLSEQAARCKKCDITPKIDLATTRAGLKLRPSIDRPDEEILHKVADLCHHFHIISSVSIWHVAALNLGDDDLLPSKQRPEDLEEEKIEVEQICLACGLHSCSMHGAFVDKRDLSDYEEGSDQNGPVRPDDPQSIQNSRWFYTTFASLLRDDEHLCGITCESGPETDGTTLAKAESFKCSSGSLCYWIDGFESDSPLWRDVLIPTLSKEEQEVFNENVRYCAMNVRGPCMMRDLLPQYHCKQLFMLIRERVNKIPHPTSSPEHNSTKTAQSADGILDTMPERLRAFFPCSHNGPCTLENNCSCVLEKIPCERSCRCDSSCLRQFKGCDCAMTKQGPCRDKTCSCWASGRECDPALCKGCGVETVLHQAYKYDESMRIGRCCNNRIQLDLPARTILAPSEVQGFGLFAGQDIKKNDFIHEYKGEIISQNESDRRGAMYSLSGQEYLFTLNPEQQLDANNFGNKARFMNNSKKPANINVKGYTMLCNGQHRIGLYAKRDIKAGEELLYDYDYPPEVTKAFWERGEKSSKEKAKVDVLQRRGTARRGRGRGAGRGGGRGGKARKVVLPAPRNASSPGADESAPEEEADSDPMDDSDAMDVDDDDESHDEADEYEADGSDSESESEQEEVPESDIDSHSPEPTPAAAPAAAPPRRKAGGASRGWGRARRGGRGRG